MRKKRLVLFDFDGTLTTRDSINDFVLWKAGVFRSLSFLLRNIPMFVRYLSGKASNTLVKEKIFSEFFSECSWQEYTQYAKQYSAQRLPAILRPEAVSALQMHLRARDRVILLTASPLEWILPWAQNQGIQEAIGSQFSKSARFTGKLQINCYGAEKLRQLEIQVPDWSAYEVVVYTDSKSDQPLLDIANKAFYRKFPKTI